MLNSDAANKVYGLSENRQVSEEITKTLFGGESLEIRNFWAEPGGENLHSGKASKSIFNIFS